MTTARAAVLLVLVATGCSRPSSAPAPPPPPVPMPVAAPTAALGAFDGTGRYVGVPQRGLSPTRMFFHPTRPMVAQLVGDRCYVWDLDAGLLRGYISIPECAGWAEPDIPLPEIDSVMKWAFSTSSALSPDGKLLATARRGEPAIDLWETKSLTDVNHLWLGFSGCMEAPEPDLLDLVWTREGKLVAFFPERAVVLDTVGKARPAPFPLPRGIGRLKYSFRDRHGRYLGFTAECSSTDPVCAGVISLSESKLVAASFWRDSGAVVAWAPRSAALYKAVGERASDLDLLDLGLLHQVYRFSIHYLDLAAGDRRTLDFRSGALVNASTSPDGQCLAFSTLELGAPSVYEPDKPRWPHRIPAVELWCPARGPKAVWTLPRESDDLIWSPSCEAIAIVGPAGDVDVMSARAEDPPGSHMAWPGALPAASSRDAGWDWARGGRAPPAVDPSGRFQASEDGDDDSVRRLADGEVLHVVDSGGLFTDGYLFSTKPPANWVFRDGLDVLGGHLIRAADASFLKPTRDLGVRFLSGAPLPHPYEDHHDPR
jgi:hypothetical protein